MHLLISVATPLDYEVACNYNVVCYTSAKMDGAANEWKGVCYELLYD